MPDNTDFANSVGALDELRKQQIEKSRQKAINSAGRDAFGKKKEGMGKLISQGAAASKSPPITTQETQLANLQKHAEKTVEALTSVHAIIKERMANSEDERGDDLDSLVEKAVMLRKKLDYFQQVGNEIITGESPDLGFTPFFGSPVPFENTPGDPNKAQQERLKQGIK